MSNGGKVLVTGGKGFIGTHVVKALLDRGYTVTSYDQSNGYDILDVAKLEENIKWYKPEWIVHLAAQVYLGPSLRNPQKDAMTNIIGTLNVLEGARKYGCHLLLSSSGAVYGNNYQYPDPISPYGISKLTAEKYCQLYHKLYGLHTVIFRFSSVYGSGRAKTSVNLIVHKALKGEAITITGDGCQTRDFTHVRDVVDAILLAIEERLPSGIYDIGTGTSTSINELVTLIERLLGNKLEFQYIPQKTVGDPKRNELNVSKAARYGFKAKVSLQEGIKQLLEELKHEENLSH